LLRQSNPPGRALAFRTKNLKALAKIMKKLKILKSLILTATVFLLMIGSALAQNSKNIIEQELKVVTKEAAISILTNEVAAARALVAANNERINTLDSQIKLETENSSSLSRSYEAAKSEIMSLRAANAALERAIASQEKTIALLQAELSKERKSKKKWQKRALSLAAVAALSLLGKLL
jgi:chromosome segregation ATPase